MPKSRQRKRRKEAGRGEGERKGDCEQPHRAHSINLQPVNSHLRQCRAVEEGEKFYDLNGGFRFHSIMAIITSHDSMTKRSV